MSGLALLIPIALALGALGLLVFFWAMRNGQFEDLDGAAQRILIDDEEASEMTELPKTVHSYSRTASFTETTVPEALLNNHSTKAGTWGLIHVEQGKLRYIVCDERRAPAEAVLAPTGMPGVVEPTILHRVEPLGPVTFYVEFFR